MKNRLIHVCAIALLAGGLLAAAGCSKNKIDGDWARDNLSPKSHTLARSSEQHKNDVARAIDLNMRQITDDIDYVFMLDRARRFSKYHIPQ